MSVSWDVLALPLLEVVLMGALAGVVGALALVHRRIFFTESLTHATFPGAVAGVVVAAALSRSLAGQRADYDLLTGALFIGAVLMCLPMIALMRWLSTIPGLTSQSAAGIVLTFGFALGYFLVKWFAPLPLKVDGFLTGSVLNIGLADVVMTTAVLLGALAVLAVAGRLLAFHGFDPVGYRAAGLRSGPVEAVLLILICLTIAALVPAVPVVYPALTVEENLAWPLRRQRLSPEQLRRQVTEMASLLGVLDVLHVRAGQLAPATAQRVAIGRALIREDLGLLLLDDALQVLDAEGRRRMVGCLRQVQRSRRMCILISTRGQPDVMGLGDEWLMLDQGRILQQGRPAEFVQYPRTMAVASRLGGSGLNVLPCRSDGGVAHFAGVPLLPPSPPQLDLWLAELQGQSPKSSIEMAIRAEHVVLGRPGQEGCIEALLTHVEDDGTWMQLHGVLPGTEIPLCARVLVDTPAAYDLAVLSGSAVAGRREKLQIINRHSLFFVDGRLVQ